MIPDTQDQTLVCQVTHSSSRTGSYHVVWLTATSGGEYMAHLRAVDKEYVVSEVFSRRVRAVVGKEYASLCAAYLSRIDSECRHGGTGGDVIYISKPDNQGMSVATGVAQRWEPGAVLLRAMSELRDYILGPEELTYLYELNMGKALREARQSLGAKVVE